MVLPDAYDDTPAILTQAEYRALSDDHQPRAGIQNSVNETMRRHHDDALYDISEFIEDKSEDSAWTALVYFADEHGTLVGFCTLVDGADGTTIENGYYGDKYVRTTITPCCLVALSIVV